VLDGLREDRRAQTETQIGTTRRGVGPAYEGKAARRGVRVRDLFDTAGLRARLQQCKGAIDPELERLGSSDRIDVDAELAKARAWARWLEDKVCDAGALCQAAIDAGQRVLFEGAQGTMLDVDHGTYPFVTSSNAIAGGVCTGIGIGPTQIDAVWGITKAYTTRVGAGPFPSRIDGDEGVRLREAGQEYGATTGRPRDCGWLDLAALRYAARVNGLSGLCVTKLDVLADLPRVQICVGYEDGVDPGCDDLDRARPRLETVEGWGDPHIGERLRQARKPAEIPAPVRAYLDRIEQAVGVPVVLASVGPGREQTIVIGEAFAR
jgi:adenylosuccinate synthase